MQVRMRVRSRWLTVGVAALGLALVTVSSVAAQAAGCPVIDDATVSGVVGSAMSGAVDATAGGLISCSFSDGSTAGRSIGVSRETNAFGPAEGGTAALARRYIPGLPDEAQAEISALNQAGLNVTLPDYQFESISGVGDAALWVKTQLVPGVFKDSLLVQRGSDAFAFDVDDSPDARASLTALAQAVLAAPAR